MKLSEIEERTMLLREDIARNSVGDYGLLSIDIPALTAKVRELGGMIENILANKGWPYDDSEYMSWHDEAQRALEGLESPAAEGIDTTAASEPYRKSASGG